MRRLTRIEQETTVLFNEEEAQASIYTCNQSFQKKLRKLSEKFPSDVKLEREDGYGAKTYIIPKAWIKLHTPCKLSDAERKRRAAVLKANLIKKSPRTSEDSAGKRIPGRNYKVQ